MQLNVIRTNGPRDNKQLDSAGLTEHNKMMPIGWVRLGYVRLG